MNATRPAALHQLSAHLDALVERILQEQDSATIAALAKELRATAEFYAIGRAAELTFKEHARQQRQQTDEGIARTLENLAVSVLVGLGTGIGAAAVTVAMLRGT